MNYDVRVRDGSLAICSKGVFIQIARKHPIGCQPRDCQLYGKDPFTVMSKLNKFEHVRG